MEHGSAICSSTLDTRKGTVPVLGLAMLRGPESQGCRKTHTLSSQAPVVWMQVCVCTSLYVRMDSCMHLCVHVWTRVGYTSRHAYVYVHRLEPGLLAHRAHWQPLRIPSPSHDPSLCDIWLWKRLFSPQDRQGD